MTELFGLKLGRPGLIGAATGVVVGGAAIGLAVERVLIGRSRRPDPELDIPLGSLRGEPAVVTADDGVELYAEVDEPTRPNKPALPTQWTGRGRRRGRDTAHPLTVVLVHGYALNLDSWHFQRRAVNGHYRTLLYDQRSHGRSGRSTAEHCTIDQMGADLAAVIEQLAPEGPLVLVGHSMGGMAVLALARRHPELFADRVAAVALLAASAGDMDGVTLGVPGLAGRLVNRVVPSFIAALSRAPDLVENGRQAGSDIGYLMTRRYSFASKVPAARVEFLTEMLGSTSIDVVAEFFPGISSHDEYAALSVLQQVETLVMCGQNDLIVPIEHSRRLRDGLPLATYVELPDCGHMLTLEYPAIVNERLLALVRDAEAMTEAAG